jgi:hypothetical protein
MECNDERPGRRRLLDTIKGREQRRNELGRHLPELDLAVARVDPGSFFTLLSAATAACACRGRQMELEPPPRPTSLESTPVATSKPPLVEHNVEATAATLFIRTWSVAAGRPLASAHGTRSSERKGKGGRRTSW